jgi:ABC-type branched-subunit amino acid transport system ATPase component
MIAVNDLCGFRAGGIVVQNVSFSIAAGEVVGVLGRNGVGKTSMVAAMLGLIPRSGSIELNGKELGHLSPHLLSRAGIALVPQGRGLFPHLSVRENLELAWHRRGRIPADAIDRSVRRFPPIRQLFNRLAGRLSGGEQQMLALVRAMLNEPKVVLMDEPSEGLAPRFVERVGELIGDIAREGTAVLLIEQNLRLGLQASQRVMFMEKGRIAHLCDRSEARSPELLHRYLAVG